MKGVLARFDDTKRMVEAIHSLRERGYRRLDAIMPYENEEVEEALEIPRTPLTWVVGAAATLGATFAMLVLWWTNAHDYPIDVGGRPIFSFWTDIPITFETAVLSAGVVGFISFFWASGMPRLHHPWFEIANTDQGFWLAVDASDPEFHEGVRTDLRELGAVAVESYEEEEE